MVTNLQPLDSRAELFHDSRPFVAAHQWDRDIEALGVVVQVRVAQTAGHHPDQHLSVLG